MEILKEIAKKVLSAVLTESFVKEVVIFLLKELAKKSDNKIDDEVVRIIEKALKPKEDKQSESKDSEEEA